MTLIAAVDLNWGIGYRGELLCRVRADLKNFRDATLGKAVILGSRTLATFPGGKPLKNRRNIVLSRRPGFSPEGAETVRSLDELLALPGIGDAVVIGGESVYRQLLPFCDTALITCFDHAFPSDAFLPNLDRDPEWVLVSEGEPFFAEEGDSLPGMACRYRVYRRKSAAGNAP